MDTWPRVTSILEAVGLIDTTWYTDEGRSRGKAVHGAIEGLAYGYLDEAEVPPDIAGFVSAYRKWLAESGFEPVATEVTVKHPTWQYVGHPDQWGWWQGKRTLIDYKTGTLGAVVPQCGGYTLAWRAERPTEPIDIIAAVKLNTEGTYKVHEIEIAEAEALWTAAIVVYRAQPKRGTHHGRG